MDRLAEIEKEREELYAILEEKDRNWDFSKSFDAYCDYLEPENKKLHALDVEERLSMPYELSDLSDYGDVMPLNEFIALVKNGMFIDYDGFGYYVKDGKETNIKIHPSDIEMGAIRKEFSHIIWFNK